MTKELREVKEVKVPSLWKFDPCKKHEDYVVGCGGCEEEVLTARLEKAYLAGHAAALAEKPAERPAEQLREEIRNALICDKTTGAGDYDEAVEYADRIVGKAAKNPSQNTQNKPGAGLLLDAVAAERPGLRGIMNGLIDSANEAIEKAERAERPQLSAEQVTPEHLETLLAGRFGISSVTGADDLQWLADQLNKLLALLTGVAEKVPPESSVELATHNAEGDTVGTGDLSNPPLTERSVSVRYCGHEARHDRPTSRRRP